MRPHTMDQTTRHIAQRELEALKAHIREHRRALAVHVVYTMLEDPRALTLFMTSHVFAVWDFMTLLKALQLRLTGMQLPWRPSPDPENARLINEIVLCEESDEVAPGEFLSHFELYREAMEEVGADRGPIDTFIDRITAGTDPGEALTGLSIPEPTAAFVRHTLQTAGQETHQVAAAFLFGREDVIPGMFRRILATLRDDTPEPEVSAVGRRVLRVTDALSRRYRPEPPPPPRRDALRIYLERHIEIDSGEHGPMGERLLMRLCGNDLVRWEKARKAAVDALAARRQMWDGVVAQIQEDRRLTTTRSGSLGLRDRRW